MTVVDWLIVIIPTAVVMYFGCYSRKYVHGVADFLSAGRCVGRYVLSMGDVASALAVTGIIAFVEVRCKTGFAVVFWSSLIAPLSRVLFMKKLVSKRPANENSSSSSSSEFSLISGIIYARSGKIATVLREKKGSLPEKNDRM